MGREFAMKKSNEARIHYGMARFALFGSCEGYIVHKVKFPFLIILDSKENFADLLTRFPWLM